MSLSHYKTFGPDAQVLGQAMLAFVESVNYVDFEKILELHGLTYIEPKKWYPQQVWLDVFNDIASRQGASTNLVSIGMKVIDTAVMPPEFEHLPFVEVMRGFGSAYNINNRGKDIGYIETEVVDDQYIIMHDATPYPDDFVYGAYYAITRRFLKKGAQYTIRFDENVPRRGQGGEETLVHITWM